MNYNPINSNTSTNYASNSIHKNRQDYDKSWENIFLNPKMNSTLETRNIDAIFRVHGDSI